MKKIINLVNNGLVGVTYNKYNFCDCNGICNGFCYNLYNNLKKEKFYILNRLINIRKLNEYKSNKNYNYMYYQW